MVSSCGPGLRKNAPGNEAAHIPERQDDVEQPGGKDGDEGERCIAYTVGAIGAESAEVVDVAGKTEWPRSSKFVEVEQARDGKNVDSAVSGQDSAESAEMAQAVGSLHATEALEESDRVVSNGTTEEVVSEGIAIVSGGSGVGEAKDCPSGRSYQVFIIDFGQSRLKREDGSELDWGRAKWTQDEEGAVGLALQHKLKKLGAEICFEHSERYLDFAETEDEDGTLEC